MPFYDRAWSNPQIVQVLIATGSAKVFVMLHPSMCGTKFGACVSAERIMLAALTLCKSETNRTTRDAARARLPVVRLLSKVGVKAPV